MKGDLICTVIVPELQTDVPFCEVGGNPSPIELANEKAKLMHVEETSGGEGIKNMNFYNTDLHPVCV